ncbi:MAG TPA: DUF1698 domain-containing protein, partial [Blastocatellia bacterium]|nr:DUF1698 domain-containing protein [Blastocatellia bacterium]
MTQQEAEEILRGVQYWHYPFDLPWGKVIPTRASPERHLLRRQHLFHPLLELYGGSLASKTVLDVGCCQGFWSFAAAEAGAAHSLGIDSSQIFIQEALALREFNGLSNCEFRCAHVEEYETWAGVPNHQITFFFGLFYHLADPIFALRQVMSRTDETILIDTNITNHKEPTLSIVPRDPHELTTRNSNISTPIRIVPSKAALRELLLAGGFTKVDFIKPAKAMP